MAGSTPRVWEIHAGSQVYAEVQFSGSSTSPIRLDTPAWDAWLAAATTVGFAYPLYDPTVGYIRGWMTVRKERRMRGGSYWVVYCRLGARVQKRYLGRPVGVSSARLAALAQEFVSARGASAPGTQQGGADQRDGTERF